MGADEGTSGGISDVTARRLVYVIQFAFFLIALVGLNGPFVSAHFERQNQTYDIARHVFHTGWEGLVIPKASFTLEGFSALPFTVARLEFPFFGLFGWPVVTAFGHERGVVRLIAVVFSLVSIYISYRILRHWLQPASALLGTALWASAPLVLHFGQVPMPDILSTTGMMLSFYLALKGKMNGSSVAFAFTVLAKETVIVFGLPVLVALLLAKDIKSWGGAARTAALWCAAPAVALAGWIALGLIGPPTPWTLLHLTSTDPRGPLSDLLSSALYFQSAGSLMPFGLGVIGTVALLFAWLEKKARIERWMIVSIVFASLFYFVFVVRRILEPQYFLPLLFWLVAAASFGFAGILRKCRSSRWWRVLILSAVAAHVVGVWYFAMDLKASRVPDLPAIERAAQLLPAAARVAVVDLNYRAAPAIWLDRNVEIVRDLAKDLPAMESANFGYLIILDFESHHHGTALQTMSLPAIVSNLKLVFSGGKSSEAAPVTALSSPSSETRRYCDLHFQRIFESPFVVLYVLPHGSRF